MSPAIKPSKTFAEQSSGTAWSKSLPRTMTDMLFGGTTLKVLHPDRVAADEYAVLQRESKEARSRRASRAGGTAQRVSYDARVPRGPASGERQ
jgi:hypothetical protein